MLSLLLFVFIYLVLTFIRRQPTTQAIGTVHQPKEEQVVVDKKELLARIHRAGGTISTSRLNAYTNTKQFKLSKEFRQAYPQFTKLEDYVVTTSDQRKATFTEEFTSKMIEFFSKESVVTAITTPVEDVFTWEIEGTKALLANLQSDLNEYVVNIECSQPNKVLEDKARLEKLLTVEGNKLI